MLDDHSKLAPLLPIPNRTVKRLSADDSAGSRVKVGHRQALMPKNAHSYEWAFCFVRTISCVNGKPSTRPYLYALTQSGGWRSPAHSCQSGCADLADAESKQP